MGGGKRERKREREREKRKEVEWLRYFRTAQVGSWGKGVTCSSNWKKVRGNKRVSGLVCSAK
jgi:hypothetical protein